MLKLQGCKCGRCKGSWLVSSRISVGMIRQSLCFSLMVKIHPLYVISYTTSINTPNTWNLNISSQKIGPLGFYGRFPSTLKLTAILHLFKAWPKIPQQETIAFQPSMTSGEGTDPKGPITQQVVVMEVPQGWMQSW